MMFERYGVSGSEGSQSIDLDPTLGQGEGSYQVQYWFGVRTPEVGSGGTLDCFATDRLGFEAQNGHPGPFNGGALGGIQGVFAFDYCGLESANPSRSFHLDLALSSPGGTLEYDYRVIVIGPIAA
jgi:hypothetical protein